VSDFVLVKIECSDHELLSEIRSTFKSEAEFLEVKHFDGGLAEYVQVLLPLVTATAELLSVYFARERGPEASKRVVVTSAGDLTIEGYSREDVERIVEELRRE
jgi:hypothetical protein